MLLLQRFWKPIAAVILVLSLIGGGMYLKGKMTESELSEMKTESSEVVTTRIVETRPDGTRIETTENRAIKKTEGKREEKRVRAEKTESKYRVGVYGVKKIDEAVTTPKKPDYGISAGKRLLGPIWVDGAYNFGTRDLQIGVSVEF